MFTGVLERLHERDWEEVCPTRNCWRFVKGRFWCVLDWRTGQVKITF